MNAPRTVSLGLALAASLTARAAVAGVYEVPMQENAAGLNLLPIEAVGFQTGADGVLRLSYDLPHELTGNATVRLDMRLQERHMGFLRFAQETPPAEAACMRAAGKVRCFTGYQPPLVDPAAVETDLRARFAGDPQLAMRLYVAGRFGHEAIGLLSFDDTLPE